jgi:hypothetical protein
MHGSDRVPDLKGLQGEPWLVGTLFFQLDRNGAISKRMLKCALKSLDIADIVREAIFSTTAEQNR